MVKELRWQIANRSKYQSHKGHRAETCAETVKKVRGEESKIFGEPSARSTSVLILFRIYLRFNQLKLFVTLGLYMTSTASISPLMQDIWQIGDASTGPLEAPRRRILPSRSSSYKLKDLNAQEKQMRSGKYVSSHRFTRMTDH